MQICIYYIGSEKINNAIEYIVYNSINTLKRKGKSLPF